MAGRKSIRADKTPPRRSQGIKQMLDTRGFPLTTELGAPLVTEKEEYKLSEYGKDTAPSVVVDSESYRTEGLSTQNTFSKGDPAALPIVEQFAEQSEVSRSLLGINRKTTQQGLFSNVSTYGLDPKDWKVEAFSYSDDSSGYWWTRRPSSNGNYYPTRVNEDDKNAAIVLSANPTPFLQPGKPGIQDLLLNPEGAGQRYVGWGRYLNSIVALYIFRYMVENFSDTQLEQFNMGYLLSRYPRTSNSKFNELYWDKIWLDINQNKFGGVDNYPIIPSGKGYNFNNVVIENWRSNPSLWGSGNVINVQATSRLPDNLNVSWDSFFFGSTRTYYPSNRSEDKGHYRIRTNPKSDTWEKYFGLVWNEIRSDLKNWEFTVHRNESTVTQLEKDLKLPYFVLDFPAVPDKINNIFTDSWPSQSFGEQINLPADSNRIGGVQGILSEVTLKSIRSFRYQPGRISGFTYGVKVSEIGAGPGTVLEFGIENDTDSYMFRLSNGDNFSIVRKSTVPLEETRFLESAAYAENTKTVIRNGTQQYETVIEQKIMNGDPLGGEGESGYFLNPDTVTMYKIEFGWYGAIGARFYAYIPVGNNECRWVTLHTLVIENQLGQPCLADPFFYFKYRLLISDSSTIRLDQTISKFGASYYIDGYDEGTLYSLNAKSGLRSLKDIGFGARDWVTLMGIKPKQFLVNRFGDEFYNKKEVFPENLFITSQRDCEIKLIRQTGCPEWAYSHQEGYSWSQLPASRRLKGKFNVDPFYSVTNTDLGIINEIRPTHSAVAGYTGPSTGGFRSPVEPGFWDPIGNQIVRVVGEDLYGLFISPQKDLVSGSSLIVKLQRDSSSNSYLSSRNTVLPKNVYLPFTYSGSQGYDIEFDYFRRDQILLSTVDILSDEFYLYWVGGPGSGIDDTNNLSTMRFGFTWPSNPSTTPSVDWGVEAGPVSYDNHTFTNGLPLDFISDYPDTTLYIETNNLVSTDNYNLESGEYTGYESITNISNSLSVSGSEGGLCRGLYCKAGREARRDLNIVSEVVESVTKYYISDTESPWPDLGETYDVTIVQGNTIVTIGSTGGEVRTTEDGTTLYLLPLNSLGVLDDSVAVDVFYRIIYISSMDKRSRPRQVLVSKIGPDIPFIRMFIQGRQGAKLGGVWIGQKTASGIKVEPFTPHVSTLNNDSPLITTYAHIDNEGNLTVPEGDRATSTNRKKCGSFLSQGSTGILSQSDYPIRWLTDNNQGYPLATYYISANTPTEIDLKTIFNVSAESIVNEDDGNLATFIIARSLANTGPNEVYVSLNYYEQ